MQLPPVVMSSSRRWLMGWWLWQQETSCIMVNILIFKMFYSEKTTLKAVAKKAMKALSSSLGTSEKFWLRELVLNQDD
jgi:hypothetical protein